MRGRTLYTGAIQLYIGAIQVNVVKVSFNLPLDAVDFLCRTAERRGTTVTDTLIRAVSAEKYFDRIVRDGGKILVEDTCGCLKQVVFP